MRLKVVLLCAGYATRLYPLTEDRPKPLLPIGDKPILAWILERVAEVKSVDEAFIVTNHKFAGHFEKWAKETKYGWPLVVIDDETTSNDTRLGAIGDLAFALRKKNIEAEDILVIAGDNFFDFDLKAFVRTSSGRRPHAVIAVNDVKDRELAKQYGLVAVDGQGRVTAFYEKPKDPPTTLASCGIYWLPSEARSLLDKYLEGGNNADQPGHYMRWLAENHGLYACSLKGHWLDIGDRDSYDKANAHFREFQTHPGPSASLRVSAGRRRSTKRKKL